MASQEVVQRNERLKAMLGAAEAPAPAPDASGMDAAEQQATDLDFFDAVEYVNNQPLGLDDAVQRKLFGLYCVATDGHPPQRLAKNLSRDERAKDAAWRAAFGDHPRASDARRAYVDEVIRQAPDFLLLPPEEDEDASDAPLAKIKDDLAGSGIKEASEKPPAPPEDVFEAARAGAAALTAYGDLANAVNLRDGEGLTPLIHAVDAEMEGSARLLLEAGADANGADADGSTPLHYAALLGSMPLATLLTEFGADRSLTDEDGMTAAEVARSEKHISLAEWLGAAATPA